MTDPNIAPVLPLRPPQVRPWAASARSKRTTYRPATPARFSIAKPTGAASWNALARDHWGKIRAKRPATFALGLLLTLGSFAQAQEAEIAAVRQNSELLVQVLAEALELDEAGGLFALAVGGVDDTYLQGQGLVLEVRSPLANRRSRLALANLNSTIQSLSGRRNPFAAFQAGSRPEAEVRAADPPADDFYRDLRERITAMDFAAIDSAIQQAANSARTVRSLGGFDATIDQSVQSSLAALRQRQEANRAERRRLESALRLSAEGGADEQERRRLQDQIDALQARVESLQEEAATLARDLGARVELARQDYEAEWRAELARLEDNLYSALCDYGASLTALPEDEYVSVILIGLGEESGEGSRPDKVHVLTARQLRQCQTGSIDVPELRRLSREYSY